MNSNINHQVHLSSIGGFEYQKIEASKIVDFFLNYDFYISQGAKLPSGLIFYGYPGNGKTMFANAIIHDSKVNSYYLSDADDDDEETRERKYKKIFKQALDHAPSIVMIDEIDQIVDCNRRSVSRGSSDKQRDALRILLTEIDKVNNKGVLVIATANKWIDEIPDALVRNGRIEKHILISNPDFKDRKSVLDLYLNKSPIFKDINSEDVARLTIGCSCSALVTLVNEVLINSISSQKTKASLDDFYQPLQVIISGGVQSTASGLLDPIIYHEVGHLLADYLLNGNIGYVSIDTYGESEGRYKSTKELDEDEDDFRTFTQINNKNIVLISGLAATEIFLKEKYMGASSDLRKIKNHYEMMLGNGLIDFSLTASYIIKQSPGMAMSEDQTCDYIKSFDLYLRDIYQSATKLLMEHEELVKRLYEKLKEKRSLTVEEVKDLLKQ